MTRYELIKYNIENNRIAKQDLIDKIKVLGSNDKLTELEIFNLMKLSQLFPQKIIIADGVEVLVDDEDKTIDDLDYSKEMQSNLLLKLYDEAKIMDLEYDIDKLKNN